MSVVNATRSQMCFCPGCSHAAVLEHLGRAIDRLGMPRERVCLVTDIGCIGTADRYFDCHTFHGLHGRSVTYAEGIKRRRPEMLVVVLMGDGGAGIGTAHLVHAARRGADIKVLVCNNFNFGMTGGQHSPTTPPDGRTATTPGGAADAVFDVCSTVAVNGSAYVARHSALDVALTDHIEAALRCDGFALLDLWELCVAYYVPRNALKPQGLPLLAREMGLPFGVVQHLPRKVSAPRLSGHPAPLRGASPAAQTGPRLIWPGRREICVAGSAGQRIRSAASALGEAVVAGGLFAAQQDDFPITVRKGHSVSNLIIAERPIRHIGVERPDLLLLLSEDGQNRVAASSLAASGAVVVADSALRPPADARQVRRVDLRELRRRVGADSAALCALAWSVLVCGWIDAASLVRAFEAAPQGRFRDANLQAVRWAAEIHRSNGPGAKRPCDAPGGTETEHD